MKKHFFLLACLFTLQTAVFADNDRIITVEQLPANAQRFIKDFFPNIAVSYAEMESEMFDTSYEIIFVNGSKAEFNKKGDWKEVDCKFSEVPAGVIPQQIQQYVDTNHKGVKILEIDRDSNDYEIQLNNKMELKFDLQFRFIGID